MKPGTIYIGHLPRGFYDDQLRGYFSQFGTILKIRLARSKKTGGYKGYGYIQFASEDVAQIAAETMNNYLMFDRLVQCEFIPSEKLHPAVWKGANKKFVWQDMNKKHILLHNKDPSKETLKKSKKRLNKKDKNKSKQLLALGIQYEFPKYKDSIKKITKPKVSTLKETKPSTPENEKVTSKSPKPKDLKKLSKSKKGIKKISKPKDVATSPKVKKLLKKKKLKKIQSTEN